MHASPRVLTRSTLLFLQSVPVVHKPQAATTQPAADEVLPAAFDQSNLLTLKTSVDLLQCVASTIKPYWLYPGCFF
jgi:hypothetical protein